MGAGRPLSAGFTESDTVTCKQGTRQQLPPAPAAAARAPHLHAVVLVVHVLEPGDELARVEAVAHRLVLVALRGRAVHAGWGGAPAVTAPRCPSLSLAGVSPAQTCGLGPWPPPRSQGGHGNVQREAGRGVYLNLLVIFLEKA